MSRPFEARYDGWCGSCLERILEGDEVIYPNPGFPIYESMARYVGGVPVAAPLREANDFRMDVDEVASLITPRTRLLVFNSPHNPTGSILTNDDIAAYYSGPWTQQSRARGISLPPLAEVREEVRTAVLSSRLQEEIEKWTGQLRARGACVSHVATRHESPATAPPPSRRSAHPCRQTGTRT